jgi:hypothetical protein
MKMERTECYETLEFKQQMQGNYELYLLAYENGTEHGESLKSGIS